MTANAQRSRAFLTPFLGRFYFMAKSIKDLISKNSSESYEVLRKFYIDVINGDITETKITKDGQVVEVNPSIAVRVEAATALQRMDIDKVQGNAKSRESDDSINANSDALKVLTELAEKKRKK